MRLSSSEGGACEQYSGEHGLAIGPLVSIAARPSRAHPPGVASNPQPGTRNMKIETWLLGLCIGLVFGYVSQRGRF
jgi:hypothetical protein